LSYTALSDAELAALEQFFASAQGTLNGFTFLDPAANLLAWSEDAGIRRLGRAIPSFRSPGGARGPGRRIGSVVV
jgi:hypothetical protein